MLNPIKLYFQDGTLVEVGDPFVLRFNGKYYLYPSTCIDKNEINCFVSDDLINYSKAITVCTDEVVKRAYAPEVIYHNGDFYLCCSPKGNGHYFFKSKSPLGPFIRITDNVNNMIDGSFVLDTNFNLKFLRADHHGIAICDMSDSGKLTNRKNLEARMNGWTEGPSITYRDNRYYLTYCANHLESKGYRICYSVSNIVGDNYKQSIYNPLLVSTIKKFNSLGHCSTVLAPDLDGYYIVYHHLTKDEKRHYRDFGIDRLHFNGSMLSANASYFEVESPKMPDLYEDLSVSKNKFEAIDGFILSKLETNDLFTGEFNFNNIDNSIIIGFIDLKNYSIINTNNNVITIKDVVNGKENIRLKKTLSIYFNCHRVIRIINKKDSSELLIDNVKVLDTLPFNKGKVGYINQDNLFFSAFSNHVLGSSDLDYSLIIPGTLDCLHSSNQKDYKLDEDDVNYVTLKENEEISFKVKGYKKANYFLSILAKCDEAASLKVTTQYESKIITINSIDNEYKYIYKDLGFIEIGNSDVITLRILKGSLTYKDIIATLKENEEVNENEYTLKNIDSNSIECDFIYNSFKEESYFGLIFNATNYSNHPCNPKPSFTGYLVGFCNSLAIIDGINYGKERIYDVPLDIELNKTYHLKARIKDSICDVFLDGKKIMSTALPYPYTYGLKGIYKGNYSDVTVLNVKEAVYEEK